MSKIVRRLALAVALALAPVGAATTAMPFASAARCDDGQSWNSYTNACQSLPCPWSSWFDENGDTCQCNPDSHWDPVLNSCQSSYGYIAH
jgi:hypothetical protein